MFFDGIEGGEDGEDVDASLSPFAILILERCKMPLSSLSCKTKVSFSRPSDSWMIEWI